MSRRDRLTWLTLCALLFTAMMLDVATTHLAVHSGKGREANPAMRTIVAHGIIPMVGVKLAGLAIIACLGIATRQHRSARVVAGLVAAQAAVVGWNIAVIALAH